MCQNQHQGLQSSMQVQLPLSPVTQLLSKPIIRVNDDDDRRLIEVEPVPGCHQWQRTATWKYCGLAGDLASARNHTQLPVHLTWQNYIPQYTCVSTSCPYAENQWEQSFFKVVGLPSMH